MSFTLSYAFFEVKDLHMSLYPWFLMLPSTNIRWRLNKCLSIVMTPKETLHHLRSQTLDYFPREGLEGWAQ